MAFNFKKALAFTLAAAMVVTAAPAASVDVQAASKVKLSATKATLAAGKAKTVTIKGIKASNVKKITLKTSNKNVATVKKVSNIKFKVTGSKKLTAKKAATITAKVTLKKAVNKKTSYTLKFKATVKAANVAVKGVALSNTSPKVGATISATLNPTGATNVASYQWYANESAITGATNKSYTVLPEDEGKKLKVVVTDTEGNTFESEESTAVSEDKSGTITLKVSAGAQTDGSALNTDTLEVEFGSSLGTPNNVTWFCNGAVKAVYSLANGDLDNTAFNSDRCQNAKNRLDAGEWHVAIENTDKKMFVSNTIVVTDQTKAVMTDVSIEDDYDSYDSNAGTMRLELADKTETAILNVTFNKNYAGKLYLINSKYTKDYSGTQITNTVNLTAGGPEKQLKEVTSIASLTNKNATTYKAQGGIYFEDTHGKVHCKFVVDLKRPGNESTNTTADEYVTRGDKYYLAWDQLDISDDEVNNTAKKENLNTSAEFTVPYVKAPASIKVTKFAKDTKAPEVTMYDESGNVLSYWQQGDDVLANFKGFNSAKVYGVDTNAKASDDTGSSPTNAKVKDGVITFTTGAVNKKYAYVTMKTTAGIFAEKSATLESSVSETAIEAVTEVKLEESKTTAEDAIVTLKGLSSKAPGTVYIQNGDSTTGTDLDKIANKDKSVALKSAHVEGGASSVTIEGVFNAKQMADANEKFFVAVFIPDDEELWLSANSIDRKGTLTTTDDKSFELKPEITSVDKSDMTAVTTASAVGVDSNTEHTVTLEIGGIQLLDQFGNNWKGDNRATDAVDGSATKVVNINKESAAGTVAVDGTTGKATILAIMNMDGTKAGASYFDKDETFTWKIAALANLTITAKTKHAVKANGSPANSIIVDKDDNNAFGSGSDETYNVGKDVKSSNEAFDIN